MDAYDMSSRVQTMNEQLRDASRNAKPPRAIYPERSYQIMADMDIPTPHCFRMVLRAQAYQLQQRQVKTGQTSETFDSLACRIGE